MRTHSIVKQIVFVAVFVLSFHSATVGASDTLTFVWEWETSETGLSSGPDGEIAFHLYMRTEDDYDYDLGAPIVESVDDCSVDGDYYSCQAELADDFQTGTQYYFAVAAYLVNDPTIISAFSNEVEYSVDEEDQDDSTATSSGSGGGGGCFIGDGITPFINFLSLSDAKD